MKVLGIVTEYNPFHNGHQYHLNKSIEKTKAKAVICIMSGCFLQRGTPAIVNQWSRTKMALKAGVDLVIQLPVVYSSRSAEHFAYGAVNLLDKTRIVDSLCFGSETGNLSPLKTLGQLFVQEPNELSQLIKKELTKGFSYPQARANAALKYIKKTKLEIDATYAKQILSGANSILGIEYIKALTKLNSSITPFTIKRIGPDYHSKKLGQIASASALRKRIKKSEKKTSFLSKEVEKALPPFSKEILQKNFKTGKGPIFYSDFSKPLLTLLRRINKTELTNYEGVNGGLENRIKNCAYQANSLEHFLELIDTKRFTRTRIQRILIHLLLKLPKEKLVQWTEKSNPQYLRVLGFNQRGQKLLKEIKEKSNLPLITNLANHFQSSYQPRNLKQKMLAADILASDLYSLAYSQPKHKTGGADFKQGPILNHKDD